MSEKFVRQFATPLLFTLATCGSYGQVVNTNTTIDLNGSRTSSHQYGNSYSSLLTQIDDSQTRSGTQSSAWAYSEYSPSELRSRTHIEDAPGGSAGDASAGVSTFDLATVTSNTLAVGTPVSIDLDLYMHGVLSTTFDPTSNLDFPDMYGSVSFGNPISYTETHNTGTYLVDLHIDTQVGAQAYLGLYFQTSVEITDSYIGGSITADGWNTAVFYTQSSQDVQLLSSAGFTYGTSAVPEPAPLLALGLGALALVSRRRG